MSHQSPQTPQAQSSDATQYASEQPAPGTGSTQAGGARQQGAGTAGGAPPAAGAGERQAGGGEAAAVRQPQQPFPSHNFLDDGVRTASVELLNQVLADVVVLRSHVKTAHWNVRGPDFYQLHELFDDVAETLEGHVDEIAERATALGGIAAGDVHDAVQRTTLAPMPPNLVEGQGLIDSIAADIAEVDRTLYWEMQRAEELGDLDTVDLLNEVSRDVAKALWFVEAHLQGPGAAATAAGPFAPQTTGAGQGAGQRVQR